MQVITGIPISLAPSPVLVGNLSARYLCVDDLFKQVFPRINSQVTCQVLGLMLCPILATLLLRYHPLLVLALISSQKKKFPGLPKSFGSHFVKLPQPHIFMQPLLSSHGKLKQQY